ncbi:MAG: hypothetical protein ACRCSV_01550 [Chlamydiales bacterium]
MKKINNQILSIPPYISTSWQNVATLHMSKEGDNLVLIISLLTNQMIRVPNLTEAEIHYIFQTHSKVLEKQSQSKEMMGATFGFPIKMGYEILDGAGSFLQHNSKQANAKDLPKEFLEKIAGLAKAIDFDGSAETFMKAEPHCNCPYCQIARALDGKTLEVQEEEVATEDLQFREWDIEQINEKVYIVTNPLDQQEKYQIYLGKPIGCTCGNSHCDHIRAVLES